MGTRRVSGKIKGHPGPSPRSFNGRAGVAEWWRLYAINMFLSALFTSLPGVGPFLAVLASIACIAVTTRRLHDLGLSGWLQLAPITIWGLAVWFALRGVFPVKDFSAALSAVLDTWPAPPAVGLAIAGAFSLGAALLIGSLPGQRGPNVYGEADL